MFTLRRLEPFRTTGEWKQDGPGVIKWIIDYFLSLEDKGALAIRLEDINALTGTVSVRDYGARGDGATDDTGAFQAAADTGKVVLVPKGVYLISGQVTLPYGTKFFGASSHSTIRPGDGLVTIDHGSVIHVTSTSASPFKYRSGNTFSGLTFYYPNQSRSAVSPTVYPATFTFSTADTNEVLKNNAWINCQFVNSYIWIDALRGHLDFQFYDIVGFPLYRGIRTDGCGGTDVFRGIRGSYYYFCQVGDNLAIWALANAIGIEVGRSDAFHMDRIYFGNLNAGLRFFKGSVNTLSGPYGSITGLSLDGNNYGVYSEWTHPIGVNIADMMSNNLLNDIEMPAGGDNVLQVTGFKLWGSKATPVRNNAASSTLRLSDGEIYTATNTAIYVGAAASHVQVSNVITDGTVPGITTAAAITNLVLADNTFGGAPSINNPAGTNVRFTGNKNLYNRSDREITYRNTNVGLGATVNIGKVTVTDNLGAIVRVESSGFLQGRSAATALTEYHITAASGTATAVQSVNYPSGGTGVITHGASVSGLVVTFTAAINSTISGSTLDSRLQVMGNTATVAEG